MNTTATKYRIDRTQTTEGLVAVLAVDSDHQLVQGSHSIENAEIELGRLSERRLKDGLRKTMTDEEGQEWRDALHLLKTQGVHLMIAK